jgi:hypothetical protein
MPETLKDCFDRWGLQALLYRYPGLRLRPTGNDVVVLAGPLAFVADGPGAERISDEYHIRLSIPRCFPARTPSVWETGARIPRDYHKLNDGSLCLGAPTTIQLQICRHPSLLGFVEHCLVPYLYGRSYFEQHATMPFGELDHGAKGLRQDLAALFGTNDHRAVDDFARLVGMKRRLANKQPCPCVSGQRVGRCHHRTINRLREQLGRPWFRQLHHALRTTQ